MIVAHHKATNMKHRSKKTTLVLLLSTAILLLAVAAALYHYKRGPFTVKTTDNPVGINYTAPTKDQVNSGVAAKEDFNTRPTEASQNTTTPTQGDQSTTVSTVISSSNITANTLSVRTIIQVIDNAGNCTLTLSKSGEQSVSQTAATQTMGSYTTCKGFDIDTSQLARGEWQITVAYRGSANQLGNATKAVMLQ